MKALSVRAPWWWAILHLGKDIENRDWNTNYRGTVYIHASKWWVTYEVQLAIEVIIDILAKTKFVGTKSLLERDLRRWSGYIVGTVEIVDCVRKSKSPWFFGEYGFVLENAVALETPVPCKGALGFFEVPDDLHVCEYTPHPSDEERRCDICQKLMPIF